MKIFRVLNRFEHLRENGMTETCQYAYYLNKLAKQNSGSTLSTMMHGRRQKSHWDFMLEDMVNITCLSLFLFIFIFLVRHLSSSVDEPISRLPFFILGVDEC